MRGILFALLVLAPVTAAFVAAQPAPEGCATDAALATTPAAGPQPQTYVASDGRVWEESNGLDGLQTQVCDVRDSRGNIVSETPADTSVDLPTIGFQQLPPPPEGCTSDPALLTIPTPVNPVAPPASAFYVTADLKIFEEDNHVAGLQRALCDVYDSRGNLIAEIQPDTLFAQLA